MAIGKTKPTNEIQALVRRFGDELAEQFEAKEKEELAQVRIELVTLKRSIGALRAALRSIEQAASAALEQTSKIAVRLRADPDKVVRLPGSAAVKQPSKGHRRKFSEAEKRALVEKAAELRKTPGALTTFMRENKLYWSHIIRWREQLGTKNT